MQFPVLVGSALLFCLVDSRLWNHAEYSAALEASKIPEQPPVAKAAPPVVEGTVIFANGTHFLIAGNAYQNGTTGQPGNYTLPPWYNATASPIVNGSTPSYPFYNATTYRPPFNNGSTSYPFNNGSTGGWNNGTITPSYNVTQFTNRPWSPTYNATQFTQAPWNFTFPTTPSSVYNTTSYPLSNMTYPPSNGSQLAQESSSSLLEKLLSQQRQPVVINIILNGEKKTSD